jgi:hypothetical protein
MTIKTRPDIGAQVDVFCHTTDQTLARCTVTIADVAALPCGCYHLTCDQPGHIPQPRGLELDTGCDEHAGYDERWPCGCVIGNVALFGHYCPTSV